MWNVTGTEMKFKVDLISNVSPGRVLPRNSWWRSQLFFIPKDTLSTHLTIKIHTCFRTLHLKVIIFDLRIFYSLLWRTFRKSAEDKNEILFYWQASPWLALNEQSANRHGFSRSWYLTSDMQRRIKKEIRNYETWFYDAKNDAETATDDIS